MTVVAKVKSERLKKTGKVLDRGEMVELRDTSPYWQIVFDLYGKRKSKTSRTRNKREAEKMAKALWQEMDDEHVRVHGKRGVPTKQRDAALLDAVEWFWANNASKDTRADDTRRQLFVVVDALGRNTMLSAITDEVVIEMITALEGRHRYGDPQKDKVSDDWVDIHVKILRRLMLSAVNERKFYLPDMPNWPRHTLAYVPRTREASIAELDAITAAWRMDMRPALVFLFESGLRLKNAVELRWKDVDWEKLRITVRVKAPKRGLNRKRRSAEENRKPREVVMTPVIAAILEGQIGKHEDAVFTFVSTMTRRCWRTGRKMIRGVHYPMTADNFSSYWEQTRTRCTIQDLKIHDLRRTRGSWMYRATGDIKLVKEFLHHQDIEQTDTTYAHVATEQLADGMRRTAIYEAEMRARLADRTARVTAGSSPASEITSDLAQGGGSNHWPLTVIQDKSSFFGSTDTSIEEVRVAFRRLELNPGYQALISDNGEMNGASVMGRGSHESAGNSACQKANFRKIPEVGSSPESHLITPQDEQLTSRFARSCEPYLDDPGFMLSFVEAFDRCFSTYVSPNSPR